MFKTVKSKIILAIITTTLLAIVIGGAIPIIRINNGFDNFIYQQNKEFGFGYGKNNNTSDEQREQRHQEIINEFKNTVNTSIIVSSLLGITFAIAIGFIISREITSPLEKLKNALKKVSKNEYHTRADEFGSKEIQELIREFNKLVAELERIEELRDELVSDVSHEIKTPITRLKGRLEGLRDGIYKNNDKNVKILLENIDQLEFLVSQLQKFSEIKAGKRQINRGSVNVREVINEVLSNYEKKEITVEVNIPKSLNVTGDRNIFKEVISNIVDNAYKYIDKGKIKISASNKAIVIEDTGPGIPEKDLPYIFERFYRVEKSRNKKTGGLGLGLAIVKELVKLLDWDIKVESTLGKGTKFCILF